MQKLLFNGADQLIGKFDIEAPTHKDSDSDADIEATYHNLMRSCIETMTGLGCARHASLIELRPSDRTVRVAATKTRTDSRGRSTWAIMYNPVGSGEARFREAVAYKARAAHPDDVKPLT